MAVRKEQEEAKAMAQQFLSDKITAVQSEAEEMDRIRTELYLEEQEERDRQKEKVQLYRLSTWYTHCREGCVHVIITCICISVYMCTVTVLIILRCTNRLAQDQFQWYMYIYMYMHVLSLCH